MTFALTCQSTVDHNDYNVCNDYNGYNDYNGFDDYRHYDHFQDYNDYDRLQTDYVPTTSRLLSSSGKATSPNISCRQRRLYKIA